MKTCSGCSNLPDVWPLDKLIVSDNTSPHRAYWITLQSVEHIMSSIDHCDTHSGESLPQSMVDVFERFNQQILSEKRPVYSDRILQIIEFCLKPLEEILQKYKSSIVRKHIMRPVYDLREMDTKSMVWLARQPGRTVREKLSVQNRALCMTREFSTNTPENRVVKRLLKELTDIAKQKLLSIRNSDYDQNTYSDKRISQIEKLLDIYPNQIRKTDLRDVQPSLMPKPNNVLLSDKNYSRVWRSWQWLKSYTDNTSNVWYECPERYVQTLFITLAAELSNSTHVQLIDQPCKVAQGYDGNGHGIYRITSENAILKWTLLNEICFHIKQTRPLNELQICNIKWLQQKRDKQFGFIQGDDGNRYYFDPGTMSGLEAFNHLSEGQRIVFEPDRAYDKKRNQRAINVVRLDKVKNDNELVGIVKYLKDDIVNKKRFGFIKGEDGEDYYFNDKSIGIHINFDDISVNQLVFFEIGKSSGKYKAPAISVKPHPLITRGRIAVGQITKMWRKQNEQGIIATKRGKEYRFDSSNLPPDIQFSVLRAGQSVVLHTRGATKSEDEELLAVVPFNLCNNPRMHIGQIARLICSGDKHFGFIVCNDGSEHFFDPRSLSGYLFYQLEEGQTVVFSPGNNNKEKAPRALQVVPVDNVCSVTMKIKGNKISFEIEWLFGSEHLAGTRILTTQFSIEFDPQGDIIDQRGFPFNLFDDSASERRVLLSEFGDLEGLRLASSQIISKVMSIINRNPHDNHSIEIDSKNQYRTDTLCVSSETGININANKPCALYDSTPVALKTRMLSLRYRLPGNRKSYIWMIEKESRQSNSFSENIDLIPISEIMDLDSDLDQGEVLLSSLNMFDSIARDITLNDKAQVAYDIPDTLDEFSQKNIRHSASRAFGKAHPIWRSVSAALGWQMSSRFKEANIRKDDVLIVFDSESPQFTKTVLIARHSQKLYDLLPASEGIYWERRSTFPQDDEDYLLTNEYILRTYCKEYFHKVIDKTHLSKIERHLNRLINYLVSSGKVSDLIQNQTTQWISFPSLDKSVMWYKINYNQRLWEDSLESFTVNMKSAISSWNQGGSFLQIVKKLITKNCHILFVGEQYSEYYIRRALSKLIPDGIGKHIKVTSYHFQDKAIDYIASGGRCFLERRKLGCASWKEWLPSLYLEVINNGRFDELRLMDENLVEPVLGKTIKHSISQTMVLPAGKSYYTLPLISGKLNHRPLSFEARLTSDVFPLKEDLPVKLELVYDYGLDSRYDLYVTPASGKSTPFSKLKATWTTSVELAKTTKLDRSGMELPDIRSSRATIIGNIDILYDRASWFEYKFKSIFFQDHIVIEEIKYLTKRMRSLQGPISNISLNSDNADATKCLECLYKSDFLQWLGKIAGVISKDLPEWFDFDNPNDVVRKCSNQALVLLTCLADKTPASVKKHVTTQFLSAETLSQIDSNYMICLGKMLRGNAEDRALCDIIANVLYRLFENPIENPTLFNKTITVISEMAWMDERFMYCLTKYYPGFDIILLQIIERDLKSLCFRVGREISEVEDKSEIKYWNYTTAFRNSCELFLAILKVRSKTGRDVMGADSTKLSRICKYVRRLDSMISKAGWDVNSRIAINDEMRPDALSRMSPLSYAVNLYTLGKVESNMVMLENQEVL